MRYFALLFIIALSINTSYAEGIEFFHGTWEEALEKSKTQDKPIFVDAYTTWCGPCKRMAKTVFTQEAVGAFYNDNFICMKIDMEKPEGRKFQQKYPVSAYPTLYYIDGNGETIFHTKGASLIGHNRYDAFTNLFIPNQRRQDANKCHRSTDRTLAAAFQLRSKGI